jgi:hypothetical protein
MLEFREQTERPILRIFPWSLSATGRYSTEQLAVLKNNDIEEIVGILNEQPHEIFDTMAEIVGHGNIRRAVRIARGLVSANPAHEQLFKTQMDRHTMHHWFKVPLGSIPSKPTEILVPVEYIH